MNPKTCSMPHPLDFKSTRKLYPSSPLNTDNHNIHRCPHNFPCLVSLSVFFREKQVQAHSNMLNLFLPKNRCLCYCKPRLYQPEAGLKQQKSGMCFLSADVLSRMAVIWVWWGLIDGSLMDLITKLPQNLLITPTRKQNITQRKWI